MKKIVFWKDRAKQLVDPELFSTVADKLAEEIKNDGNKMNKRSQIRKFYDEVVRLDMMSKSRPDEWVHILPLVHMITAKAAYAKGRNLISDNFNMLIKNSVDQVKTPKDLNVFHNFFESFMGFYRMYRPGNN